MSIEPRRAQEGRQFTSTVMGERIDYTVVPSCGATTGAWYCITHDRTFRHNLEKDGHLSDHEKPGGCELAWLCYEHGPEVP